MTKDVEVRLVLDMGDDDYPGDDVAAEALRRHLEGETIYWASAVGTLPIAKAGACAVIDEAEVTIR